MVHILMGASDCQMVGLGDRRVALDGSHANVY